MKIIQPAQIQFYFERFGYCSAQIFEPPHPALGMVVVIPCRREPNLMNSLDALWACERPGCSVEVIVVINSSEDAPNADVQQNAATRILAEDWARAHGDERFVLRIIEARTLTRRSAGVGLARKIGMDEALRRFERAGGQSGVIVCFDADCTCEPNYFVEIEKFFLKNPKAPGCSIYFEHPLSGSEVSKVYEAVTLYELHLRYYVQGLRYAGFPHAFHTVGSSMAVRAHVYMEQGGMNRRKAGEDFYFLQKVIPLGEFGEVNTTCVHPSPRVSDRVPFGTGKAVGEYLERGTMATYPVQAFDDLRLLFSQVRSLYRKQPTGLPAMVNEFLHLQAFDATLGELRSNCHSVDSFECRFFRWFNGFLAMKCIHFLREHKYGSASIVESAKLLLEREGLLCAGHAPHQVLQAYRHLQRRTWPQKSTGPRIDAVLVKEFEINFKY